MKYSTEELVWCPVAEHMKHIQVCLFQCPRRGGNKGCSVFKQIPKELLAPYLNSEKNMQTEKMQESKKMNGVHTEKEDTRITTHVFLPDNQAYQAQPMNWVPSLEMPPGRLFKLVEIDPVGRGAQKAKYGIPHKNDINNAEAEQIEATATEADVELTAEQKEAEEQAKKDRANARRRLNAAKKRFADKKALAEKRKAAAEAKRLEEERLAKEAEEMAAEAQREEEEIQKLADELGIPYEEVLASLEDGQDEEPLKAATTKAQTAKRGPGRPPKKASQAKASESKPAKRGPGRPRKNK